MRRLRLLMKRLLPLWLLAWATIVGTSIAGASVAWAAGDCGPQACMRAPVDITDKASLQRGAGLFMSYCAGCHSARYLRYERLSRDLDIDPRLVEKYLMFAGDSLGDPVQPPVSAQDQARWFGNAPPDLTLATRLHSPDWVYSYLLGFYADDSRPWGVNNRVVRDVAMPDALAPLRAALPPAEFRAQVGDLVNFMAWMADPTRITRERTGLFVLLFLAILIVPVWLLNREFWKGVK